MFHATNLWPFLDPRANFYLIRMLQLATTFDFVAHMVAATSAEWLALRCKSLHALQHASRYRSLALRGMAEALKSLSRENADAILAAFLIYSSVTPDG